MAIAQCERYYGAAWYWCPQRWRTVDGYAPWAVLWVAWRAMNAVAAHERLSMARAVALGMATGPAATAARQAELEHAYPDDD